MTGLTLQPQLAPALHAKLLCWDTDDVVITSQNWLSADPSDANVRRELGIHLQSPGAADTISAKLLACFPPAQVERTAMQNHPSRASDHLLSKMWKTKGSRF